MVTFGSYDEAMEAAKSSESDREVVEAILTGDFEIVEGSTEDSTPVEQTDEIQNTVSTEHDETVVKQEQDVSPVEENVAVKTAEKTPEEIASELYEAKLKEISDRHEKELEELRKQVDVTQTQEPENNEVSVNIEVDDEDSTLASEYEKKTRLKLKEVTDKLLANDNETAKKLKEIEEAKELILQNERDELDRLKREQELSAVCQEIEGFTKGKEGLELPVGVREAYDTSMSIRKAISTAIGSEDAGQIEKAYRYAIRGKGELGQKVRQKLEESNVEIPEYMQTYLTVTELDDTRRGIKFNEVTSEFERLSLSLQDVYRLREYNNELNKEIKREVKNIANTLNGREQSAKSLLDIDVVETAVESSMTFEEAKAALSLPLSAMKAKPELAKKYAEACALAKSPVPDSVKELL